MKELNPHISVDCVIFGFDGEKLKVLLINRSKNDTGDKKTVRKKLPGDLIIKKEILEESANRILQELTGLNNIYLKQFGVFDKPERLNTKDDLLWLHKSSGLEIERVVTIAYYSVIDIRLSQKTRLSMAFNAQWIPVDEVPELIFDHNEILRTGLDTLRREFLTEPLCFELLPDKFTLNQLQRVYETILGFDLDNRNFRKRINKLKYIVPLNEKQTGVSHKPANLYGFDREKYIQLKKEHTGFVV